MQFYFKRQQSLYFSSKPYLGFGAEGICHKINENQAAKIFYSTCSGKDYSAKELLEFQNVTIPNFSFIQELIYLRFKIIGCIYPYIKGTSLLKQDISEILISELCDAIERLMPNIKKLSDMGIKVNDIAARNIIYQPGTFGFIDTACYQFSDEDPEKIFNYNCRAIIGTILYCMFEVLVDASKKYYLNEINEKFKNLNEDMDILKNPIPFIMEVQKVLEEFLNTKISDFFTAGRLMLRTLQSNQ